MESEQVIGIANALHAACRAYRDNQYAADGSASDARLNAIQICTAALEPLLFIGPFLAAGLIVGAAFGLIGGYWLSRRSARRLATELVAIINRRTP